MHVIREALSAFAVFKPIKKEGEGGTSEGSASPHCSVWEPDSAKDTQHTHNRHSSLATASWGNFSAKLLAFCQGYFQIITWHRDLYGSDNILHLSRTCLHEMM